MSQTVEQLLTAALDLPERERLELAEALMDTVCPPGMLSLDDPTIDEILLRRSAEFTSGEVRGSSWEEVKRRARESIGG